MSDWKIIEIDEEINILCEDPTNWSSKINRFFLFLAFVQSYETNQNVKENENKNRWKFSTSKKQNCLFDREHCVHKNTNVSVTQCDHKIENLFAVFSDSEKKTKANLFVAVVVIIVERQKNWVDEKEQRSQTTTNKKKRDKK